MDARRKKIWTEKEIEFLCEHWGTYSAPAIANRLSRSVCTVTGKAKDLKLGSQMDSSDMISVGVLFRELNIENSYSWYFRKMTSAGLKLHTKKFIKTSYRMVRINDFWDFAEKNQNVFDFSKLEENVFGEEPAWVKIKRSEDYRQSRERIKGKTHWTEAENRELRDLLKMHMYTAEELAKRFRRSPDSVRQHAATLLIEDRPVYRERKDAWLEDDIDTMTTLIKDGKKIADISAVLGRTRKAVRGKLYSMYSTESIEKIRLLLDPPKTSNMTHLNTKTPKKDFS